MNIYDKVNEFAQEIKNSNEYIEYKNRREKINRDPILKSKVDQFSKMRYDIQVEQFETGKTNESKSRKVKEMYEELIKNEEIASYFDSEIQFDLLIANINKTLGDIVREII